MMNIVQNGCAIIDTGASKRLCHTKVLPPEYYQNDESLKAYDIGGTVHIYDWSVKNAHIQIGDTIFKIPQIWKTDEMGVDILLGNNFLFQNVYIQSFYTYWLYHTLPTIKQVSRLLHPILRKPFHFQHSQRGDLPQVKSLKATIQDISLEIDQITDMFSDNFSEYPLALWEKDKIYAKIELIDESAIIRIKPMRYSQEDRLEFDKQIKELLEQKLIRNSESPHSSPAFMVMKRRNCKRKT